MARPAEVFYQSGTVEEFEAFVRSDFPQCIAVDENGDELVPVQYQSAYSHDVGVHYIAQLQLDNLDPPTLGNQGLMVDWHREPENTDQSVRVQTRVLLTQIAEDPDTTATNRGRARRALDLLRTTAVPGLQAVTPSTIGWSGSPEPTAPAAQAQVERLLNGD